MIAPPIVGYVDPFTQVQNAIGELLAAHDGFRRCFKKGNRLNAQSADRRENLLDADLPDFEMQSAGLVIQPWRSNTSADVRKGFRVVIAAGSLDERLGLNIIHWEILRAFAGVTADLGLPFVRLVTLGNATDTPESQEKDGNPTWQTVMEITVDMSFTRSELKAQIPQLAGA